MFLAACSAAFIIGQNVFAESNHEATTMQSPFRNMSAFIDIVHEKYPEINLEVIPYSGKNYTAYVRAQLAANDMPDIYCTTFYTPGHDEVSDKLFSGVCS